MSNQPKPFWWVTWLFLFLVPAPPAGAQTTLAATAGLGGWARPGRGIPVQVTLENRGESARAGVILRMPGADDRRPLYRLAAVSLPAGARRRYFLYPPAPAVHDQGLTATLQVDGQAVSDVVLPGQYLEADDWLLVGAGASFNFLSDLDLGPPGWRNGPAARLRVASVPPAELPDRATGYEAADLLVLGDFPLAELAAQQRAAIADWVAAGGTLVVPAGAGWQRLRDPFYDAFLPAVASGSTVESGAPGLAALGGAGLSGHPFVAAVATPRPAARVLARAGSLPLVIEGRHGFGRVLYLAFDPAAPPFRDWAGAPAFWRGLIRSPGTRFPFSYLGAARAGEWAEAPDPSGYRSRARGPGNAAAGASWTRFPGVLVRRAPAALSQTGLPGFWGVALFLGAYLVTLVPLNFLFLQWRRRHEWGWVTFPAIVFAFTLAAYGIGYSLRGGQVVVSRVGLVEAAAGCSRGRQLTYAAIFSPSKRRYSVTAAGPADGLAPADGPLGPRRDGARAAVVAGEPDRLVGFDVDVWELRALRAEGPLDLHRGFRLETTPGGRRLANASRLDLEDTYLVEAGVAHRVGPLPAGRTADLPAPPAAGARPAPAGLLPAAVSEGLSGEAPVLRLKRAALEPFVQGAGGRRGTGWLPPYPLLVGWARQPVAALRLDGRAAAGPEATLVFVHLLPPGPLAP